VPLPPLSHHEILPLAEPFARRGRQVDLAASDRAERRLVFKPVEVSAASAGDAALQDTLSLDCRDTRRYVLTRTLSASGGLQATLQATGPSPAALLAQVEAIEPARQFRRGEGYAIARSYVLPTAGELPAQGPPVPTLNRGVVQIDGLQLVLNLLDVRGAAGDLTLSTPPGEALALPEDLLAVLGWSWARLVPHPNGWTSRVRLRGRGLQRTAAAEAALDKAAMHLARVLAEPPALFHQRHRWARWGVVLRRGIPSLTAIALIVTSLLLPRLTGSELSGVWMALHYVPIAVLALSFTLQELARFEIPPLPRRSTAPRWRLPAPAKAGVQAPASQPSHS